MAGAFLVVEDEPSVATAVVRMLRRHGAAEIASNVRDAISKLESKPWDGLVLDVGLADGSGFDVLEAARALNPGIPAIILTGAIDRNTTAQAYKLNTPCLLKPIEARQLAEFANRVGERRSLILEMITAWAKRHGLTRAEQQILKMAALNTTERKEIAALRGTAESTIKTQVDALISKTGDKSLHEAVRRLLVEVIDRTSQ